MKRILAIAAVLAFAAPAAAIDVRQVEVTGPRISLGDVVQGAPLSLRATDLGPVPSPGGSRIVSRDEIERVLPRQSGVHVPDAVRVVRKMRIMGASELDHVARQAIVIALPHGVALTSIHAPAASSVAVGYTHITATLPRLAHHTGTANVVALVEFRRDTEVLESVSVRVDLDVSAEGAQPDVTHGNSISVVIKRGLVEISASAIASSDGDVGDIIPVSIRSTGRTLRARIESKERASVVESP